MTPPWGGYKLAWFGRLKTSHLNSICCPSVTLKSLQRPVFTTIEPGPNRLIFLRFPNVYGPPVGGIGGVGAPGETSTATGGANDDGFNQHVRPLDLQYGGPIRFGRCVRPFPLPAKSRMLIGDMSVPDCTMAESERPQWPSSISVQCPEKVGLSATRDSLKILCVSASGQFPRSALRSYGTDSAARKKPNVVV